MTARIGDLLFYQGQRMTICDAPLGTYFRLGGAYPEFEPSSTALMRGYVATWELLDDRLYSYTSYADAQDSPFAPAASMQAAPVEMLQRNTVSGRTRCALHS